MGFVVKQLLGHGTECAFGLVESPNVLSSNLVPVTQFAVLFATAEQQEAIMPHLSMLWDQCLAVADQVLAGREDKA